MVSRLPCEPHPVRQRQRGEEVIPEQVPVIAEVVALGEEQAGPRLIRCLTLEKTVSANMDEDSAVRPRRDAPAGHSQEGQNLRLVELALQTENLAGCVAARQQRLDHGGLVGVHRCFPGLRRGDEKGKVVDGNRFVRGLNPASNNEGERVTNSAVTAGRSFYDLPDPAALAIGAAFSTNSTLTASKANSTRPSAVRSSKPALSNAVISP